MGDASQPVETATHPPGKPWRWFTFRLSTLFVAITLIAVVCAWPRIWREIQFWRFKAHRGTDLSRLSERQTQSFRKIVGTLLPTGNVQRDFLFEGAYFDNLLVEQIASNRGDRWLLFQSQSISMSPNEAVGRTIFLDSNGNKVAQVDFPAGWEAKISRVEWDTTRIPGESIAVVTSGYILFITAGEKVERSKHDVVRQHYAIVGDDIALIRLENRDGELVRNAYEYPNLMFGPSFPLPMEQEMIQALQSGRTVEVLRCLTWLAGEHYPQQPRPSALLLESPAESAFYHRICKNSRLRPILSELTSDRDPWISEGAQQVLETIGDLAE